MIRNDSVLLNGIVLGVLLCTVACSRRKLPPVTIEQFEQWFTGTDESVPQNFKRCTPGSIDSIHHYFCRTSITGEGSVLVTDTAGALFTIGFSTPAPLREDTLYPCIIYLHGGTGGSRTDKGKTAFDMFSFLGDSLDLLFASPSANRDTPWWSSAGLSRILQTVRYMTLHYPVDPEKIFCAGVSDGATGCYAVANTIAMPFAGFFAVSGFGGMLRYVGMELHPQNLMQRPLYNINAGKDRLYPVDDVTMFLDELESEGVGIKRKIYLDEVHGFDYRSRETATLCSLVTTWKRPMQTGFSWFGTAAFPVVVPHVLTWHRLGDAKYISVVGGCCNDTIKVQSTGLSSLLMYFENKEFCGERPWVTTGSSGRVIPQRGKWHWDFQVMKATAVPEFKTYSYFTLKM